MKRAIAMFEILSFAALSFAVLLCPLVGAAECTTCLAPLDPGATRCATCGAAVESESTAKPPTTPPPTTNPSPASPAPLACEACGGDTRIDDETCPHCGAVFEPANPSETPAPPPSTSAPVLRWELEARQQGYRYRGGRRGRTNESYGRLRLSCDHVLTPTLALRLEPEARLDSENQQRGFQEAPYDREPIAPALTMHEAHLTASRPGTRLRLGQQLFSWGKANGFNPLDRLNPFDYTDLPQAERRTVGAASLEQAAGPVTLEGVFVPRFTPSRLPQPDGRWTVELPRTFPLLRRDLPPGNLANAQYAGRASASLAGWDLTGVIAKGHEPLPNFELTPAGLRPFYPEVLMLGGGFSRAIDRYEFHGEWADVGNIQSDADSYVQYIAGTDIRVGHPLPRELTLTMEYAGEFITVEEDVPSLGADVVRRTRSSALLLQVEYEPIDFLRSRLRGLYTLDGPDGYLVQPELRYAWNDHLEMHVGADILGGSGDSFLDRLSRADRLVLGVVLSF